MPTDKEDSADCALVAAAECAAEEADSFHGDRKLQGSPECGDEVCGECLLQGFAAGVDAAHRWRVGVERFQPAHVREGVESAGVVRRCD